MIYNVFILINTLVCPKDTVSMGTGIIEETISREKSLYGVKILI